MGYLLRKAYRERLGRAVAALFAAGLAAMPAAGEEVACRPNALGTVNCPAAEPRPMARPPGSASTQALDRVRARTKQPQGEAFVPARRTGNLGGSVLREGGASGEVCRADTLGNLRCR
jgi:hypothetical protein